MSSQDVTHLEALRAESEKKVHLFVDDPALSICGLRIHKCDVFSLEEYLDWGYDGDGQDLCTRCDLKARQIERQGH